MKKFIYIYNPLILLILCIIVNHTHLNVFLNVKQLKSFFILFVTHIFSIGFIPIIISCLALFVNYSTKNITSFKYSFDLLIKYADRIDIDLTKIKHKKQGEWVILGLLLDNDTNNRFLKNKIKLNDINIFSRSSTSYVSHENFIKQVEIVLEFINTKKFLFPKKFYVKQLRSILSNKALFFLYLYATFSKDGLHIAELIKNVHLFGSESNPHIPENISSDLYHEDIKNTTSKYFLNNKEYTAFQKKNIEDTTKCLYDLLLNKNNLKRYNTNQSDSK